MRPGNMRGILSSLTLGGLGWVSGDLLMAAIKKPAQPCNIFMTNYVYWI